MNADASKTQSRATSAGASNSPLPEPYTIKDRCCGRDHVIRFTRKRAEVLKLLQEGRTRDEVIAKGYTPSIVGVVGWQARKLGLIKDSASNPTMSPKSSDAMKTAPVAAKDKATAK